MTKQLWSSSDNLSSKIMWCLSKAAEDVWLWIMMCLSKDAPKVKGHDGSLYCFISYPQSLLLIMKLLLLLLLLLYLFYFNRENVIQKSKWIRNILLTIRVTFCFVFTQEQRSMGGNVRLDSKTLPWLKSRTLLEPSPCLSFVLFLCVFVFFCCCSVSTCPSQCSFSSFLEDKQQS